MKPAKRRTGFTLMELMIVLLIIGILLGFILAAANAAVRAAEERATQALISKLDTGLADRLEALLNQRMDPGSMFQGETSTSNASSAACLFFAYSRDPGMGGYQGGSSQAENSAQKSAYQRSGVLLRYEQLKAEIPDVFVVQNSSTYPLNFNMLPFTDSGATGDYQCVLPIGINGPGTTRVGLGIWGASYTMMAGVLKNLGKWTDPTSGQVGAGVADKGFDMVDSDGDGLIDDATEWGGDASITTALQNHQHVTARAEMLYAMLVEGQGPYGSVFSRDDFTEKEVRDTDLDGLPEFIDGWGKPIQFFRWPVLYHSDVQRGLTLVPTGAIESGGAKNPVYGLVDQNNNFSTPYGYGPLDAQHMGSLDAREQDPLDPNQQLIAPEWWSSQYNGNNDPNQFKALSSPPLSSGAVYFQNYFHLLVEPLASPAPYAAGSSPATYQRYWDRSGGGSNPMLYPRRAYYTRYLILSGGPDGKPGVPYLTDPRYNNGTPFVTDSVLKTQSAATVAPMLQVEGQAAQATLARSNDGFQMPQLGSAPNGDAYTNQLQADGQDDVTNHNLGSSSLPVQ